MSEYWVPAWTRLSCSECGTEEQATRDEPQRIDEDKWLCSECSIRSPLEQERAELFERILRLRESIEIALEDGCPRGREAILKTALLEDRTPAAGSSFELKPDASKPTEPPAGWSVAQVGDNWKLTHPDGEETLWHCESDAISYAEGKRDGFPVGCEFPPPTFSETLIGGGTMIGLLTIMLADELVERTRYLIRKRRQR